MKIEFFYLIDLWARFERLAETNGFCELSWTLTSFLFNENESIQKNHDNHEIRSKLSIICSCQTDSTFDTFYYCDKLLLKS